MPPAIPDNGADLPDPTAHRLSYDWWEHACLIEIADARAEGRPVSFKVPFSCHEANNARS